MGLFLFAALEADVDISVIWNTVSVFAPLLIGFLIFQRHYVQVS